MTIRAWIQLLIMAAGIVVLSRSALCDCIPVRADQTTISYHDIHLIRGTRPMSAVRGLVFGPSANPLDHVLVEVYDHPEAAAAAATKPRGAPETVEQHRLAACLTDSDGEFSFHLSPGRYEVRCTKKGGWDRTSLIIEVKRVPSNGRKLKVRLYVSM